MRDMTQEVVDVLNSSNVPLLVLVEMQFKSGTVRCCNAGYTFKYNGHDWIGLGQLGGISAVSEGETLEMKGLNLTLTGVEPEYIAIALGSEYQGQLATIWLAPLDHNYQILIDPVIIFKGRMDTMSVDIGKTATVQVAVESKLVDWERPRILRYNDADQQSLYPGDKGFEFVAEMTEKDIIWGRS